MNYKITKKFGHFVYNEKNGSHKIKWYEVDEVIDQTTFNRFTKATQLYCKKINTRKKKSKG